ncbi:MAG: MFS transporter [Syntrophobacteraceae bacterium]
MAVSSTVSEQAGDKVYRKITWRLLPFLLLCYVVAQIDRFNIGFAKLQFIKDLNLNDAIFGVAASMFAVGYVAFEVPSNLMLARIGVRKTLLRIMVLWGIFSLLMSFAQGAYYLYLMRFLLGVAEAGFFPGIIVYLTYWFPNRHRGRIMSLFVISVPIAGAIGGPLSGWLMDRFNGLSGWHGWQWLFLMEGLPAVVLGVIAYFYLQDNPERAGWLSNDEKQAIIGDLEADRISGPGKPSTNFREALRDPKIYLFSIIYFAYFCSLNTILLWSPTLLRIVGLQKVTDIGWWSGLISVISTIGMLLAGYSSDRFMERRWHVALCGLTAAACFLVLPLAAHSVGFTIALLMVASIGIFSVLSLFWTIPSTYLGGGAMAGGIALISSIGYCGAVVSPTLVGWIKVSTGSLYIGLSTIALMLILAMLLLLVFVPATSKVSISPSR